MEGGKRVHLSVLKGKEGREVDSLDREVGNFERKCREARADAEEKQHLAQYISYMCAIPLG